MTDTPRRKRWPTWLLVASLALNVLVIGAVAGMVLRGPVPYRDRNAPLPGVIGLLRAVPDSHRDTLRATLRADRDTARARRAEVATLRADFLSALESDPLDEAALRALLDRYAGLERDISARGRSLLLDTILTMDADARRQFASRARDMGRHRGGERRGD